MSIRDLYSDNQVPALRIQGVTGFVAMVDAEMKGGHPYEVVILGKLYDDSRAAGEVSEWCRVAKVLHSLKGARMGLMGHVLEAMYDMHADPTAAFCIGFNQLHPLVITFSSSR